MKLISKLLIFFTILALTLAKVDLDAKEKQLIKDKMKNITTLDKLKIFVNKLIDSHKSQKGKEIQKELDKIGSKASGLHESIWNNPDIQEKIKELQHNQNKKQKKLRRHR